MMDNYDPEIAPDPTHWLELDEDERILAVEAYHRAARISLPKAARRSHAAFHTIVENQLALNVEPVIRALRRFDGAGTFKTRRCSRNLISVGRRDF